MLLQITIELDVDEPSLSSDDIDLILNDLLLSLPRSFERDEDDLIIIRGSKLLKHRILESRKGKS